MANTLILRPSKDLKVGHTKSKGKKGFILINEAAADDDATYIYQAIKSSSTSASSNFQLQNQTLSKVKITSIVVTIRAKLKSSSWSEGNINFQLTSSGVTQSGSQQSLSAAWQNLTYNVQDLTKINDYITKNDALPQFNLQITSTGSNTDPKGSANEIRITQAYITLTYEPIMIQTSSFLIKQGSKWEEFKEVYKKKSGKWTKITFDEAFSSLQNGNNNTFLRG